MTDQTNTIDAFSPFEMAERMEAAGVKKANLDSLTMFCLAVLAGSFIALGGQFFTLVVADSGLAFGLNKLVGGLTFSLGLILVVVAGAELFTGNSLMLVAWIGGRISLGRVMRNWLIVYSGNLVGSLCTATLVYLSGQWRFDGYRVGAMALDIGIAKVNLGFAEGLTRGILCNVLVCLAVWLCMSCRSVVDKILAIVFPITAFVACGFEHSIANMYFIPMAMLMKGEADVVATASKGAIEMAQLNLSGFLGNLLSVTTGNIFGGAFLVAFVYWFAFLRSRELQRRDLAEYLVRRLFEP